MAVADTTPSDSGAIKVKKLKKEKRSANGVVPSPSAAEPVKSLPKETKEERKARKRADKLAKSMIIAGSGDELDVPAESSTMASKRKSANGTNGDPGTSKSKRKKAAIQEDVADVEEAALMTGEIAEGSAAKKVKKEKKRKESREGEPRSTIMVEGGESRVPTAGSVVVEATGVEEQEKDRPKKERKEREEPKEKEKGEKTGQEKNSAVKATDPLPDGDEAAESELRVAKEAKKEKKRTNSEAAVPTTDHVPMNGNAAPEPSVEAPAKEVKKDRKRTVTEGTDHTRPSISAKDISADETLSDQAKKGLLYAQQHATSHLRTSEVGPGEGWKFSKAKQGWLIRQIWNHKEIPDMYVDLVLGYLRTVQSGARSGLIDTAKKHVKAGQGLTAKAEVRGTPRDQEGGTTADGPLENSKAAVDEDGAEGTEAEGVRVRKERAERMLKVIGAR